MNRHWVARDVDHGEADVADAAGAVGEVEVAKDVAAGGEADAAVDDAAVYVATVDDVVADVVVPGMRNAAAYSNALYAVAEFESDVGDVADEQADVDGDY